MEISEHYLDKENLLELYRLQKALLIEEDIVASIEDCGYMWKTYSNELSAHWLSFPFLDKDILRKISSSPFFTSYEDYIK